MRKSFREVIRDVKEGELYIGEGVNITCGVDGRIAIVDNEGGELCLFFDKDDYEFYKSIKTYHLLDGSLKKMLDEGKTMKNGDIQLKKIDGEIKRYNNRLEEWVNFYSIYINFKDNDNWIEVED